MRNEGEAGRRPLGKTIAAVVLLAFVSCLFFIYMRYIRLEVPYHPVPFDRSRWTMTTPQERGLMAFDLFPPGKMTAGVDILTPASPLYGMTRHQVVQFLGPPDGATDNFVMYDLGYIDRNPNVWLVEPYALVLQFDDQGNLVFATIST
jgi:hypothetical protein